MLKITESPLKNKHAGENQLSIHLHDVALKLGLQLLLPIDESHINTYLRWLLSFNLVRWPYGWLSSLSDTVEGLLKRKDFQTTLTSGMNVSILRLKLSIGQGKGCFYRYFQTKFGHMGEHIHNRIYRVNSMVLIDTKPIVYNTNTANDPRGCFTVQLLWERKDQLYFGKRNGVR